MFVQLLASIAQLTTIIIPHMVFVCFNIVSSQPSSYFPLSAKPVIICNFENQKKKWVEKVL